MEVWLVGCFGFNSPLRQYFSLYRAVSRREGEREEKRIDESKNVQTTPTRTYYKRSRPLPYCNPNCRTPRHWKFTQHHRTARPPPWKYGIMNDLHEIGLKGRLPSFVQNFLSNREFKVRVGSTLSEAHNQEQGVPQGSILFDLCSVLK